LAGNFTVFALLNLLGAALAYATLRGPDPVTAGASNPVSMWDTLARHFRNPQLRASCAIGFLILFIFIGTFTSVNFMLVAPPFNLGPMQLGFVYFVFLPSILTTPLAGRAAVRYATRRVLWTALAIAAIGLALLLLPDLAAVLLGLVLVGVGTFFAQATATGY